MAWCSPKVYEILSSSEEGKNIIERLPDLTKEEFLKELGEFFDDNPEYLKARLDDELLEEKYNNFDTDIEEDK